MKKILYVDDDKFLTDMYGTKLTEAGFEFHNLENAGGDFIDKVVEINPDLILLDIVMPGPDGFEAMKILKADDRTKSIPAMFESNMGQKEDIERGMDLGAVDYIVICEIVPAEFARICASYLNDPANYKPIYSKFIDKSNEAK